MSGQRQFKNPGSPAVTGARDKPLRTYTVTVNTICEGLLLLVISSLRSRR